MSDDVLTVGERYSCAISAPNLRVTLDRPSVSDLVIAAGMSPHRMGLALRRLASEWDAVGKPPPPSPAVIEALAAKYPRIEGSGLVLVVSKDRAGAVIEERLIPLIAAKREAEKWHQQEMGMLFQRLQSLPGVRDGLSHWAQQYVDDPAHLVGAVLMWWLCQICKTCGGVKKKVVEGTGRTNAKNCPTCKGSGEAKIPHGAWGKKLLGYMHECLRRSTRGMSKKTCQNP